MQSGLPPRSRREGATVPAAFATLLAQVSLEASRGDNLDEVLRRIVACVTEHLPISIASIILLNEAGSHFVQEVSAGAIQLEPPVTGAWPVSIGAAGRCARTGQPQLIADVRADPDYVPGNHEVRAEYLVPIRHGERLLGVFNLESTAADFFTDDACAMFDAVARQVAGTIHLARVLRQLEDANRRLQRASLRDGLTGIANRRCFDHALIAAWRSARRARRPLALVLADIDHFKRLNDSRGHVFADQCLRQVAEACAARERRSEDLAARYGGEEFVMLLHDCGPPEARQVADALCAAVAQLAIVHPDSPVAPYLTVSAGVAAGTPGQAGLANAGALLEQADLALYQAKHGGRNRVMVAA